MKRTPNINLPQFEETDRYRLEDYNEAYSIIDKEISDIGTQLDSVNASLDNIMNQTKANVKRYGAICDGVSHKLSEKFSSLEDARKIYNVATSLNDEIDYCAIQQALKDNKLVFLPKGTYIINKPLFLSMYNCLEGEDITSTLIKKLTNEGGVPNSYSATTICQGFPDIVHNFNKDSIFIGYHLDNENSYSIKIKNISAYGVNNKYGIYIPMSSACSYDNVRITDVERAYVTYDSWNVNMKNIEFINCVDGIVHENGENNASHYWTGTSLTVNGIQFSNVDNCISAKNLAYSTFNGVTCDSRDKTSNGTKVFKFTNCSGIVFNGLGVEHQKPKDNVFYMSYSSVVINGLTFEAGVSGGLDNTDIFYVTNSSQLLINGGKIALTLNDSKIFNIHNASNVIVNNILEQIELLPNTTLTSDSNITVNNTNSEKENKMSFIECSTDLAESLPSSTYKILPLVVNKNANITMIDNSIRFPYSGIYTIEIALSTTFGVADKRFIIKLGKNGSDFKMLSDNRYNGSNGEIFKGVYTGYFEKNDYINVLVYTDTSNNTLVTDSFKSYINVCKL